jgi:hypothetical protein
MWQREQIFLACDIRVEQSLLASELGFGVANKNDCRIIPRCLSVRFF